MCACSLYRYIGGIGCPATCYGYFASSFLSIIFFFFCSIALIFRSIFPFFFSNWFVCYLCCWYVDIYVTYYNFVCTFISDCSGSSESRQAAKVLASFIVFFLLLRFVLYIPGSLIFNKKRSKLFRIFESVFFLVHML